MVLFAIIRAIHLPETLLHETPFIPLFEGRGAEL